MKMRFEFVGKYYEKIVKKQKEFYRSLALMMLRKSKKENTPPKIKSRGILRFCFKLTVFAIIPLYLIWKRYKYYLENDPKFLRDNFTEKLFNNERIYKFLHDGKANFDFFKVLDYLLIFNLIPGANISNETKEKLKCKLTGKDYSYPIGLDSGLDLAGLWTINLSKLGFEYIMVGPLTDINLNFANYNKEFVDFNKFKKFLDQPKSHQAKTAKIIDLDYALGFLHEIIQNQSVKSNIKNLGIEVFFSQTSHTLSPFILQKRFSHYLNRAFDFADSISIELNHPNESLSLKYKSPKKLQYQLDCLKPILLRNLGLIACFEYEFIYGMRQARNSVSDKIRPRSHILRKKKPDVLIRLSDDASEEYLFDVISVLINSGIVNGILLDSALDKEINEKERMQRKFKQEASDFPGAASKPNSPSNLVINKIRKVFGSRIAIISCGGVFTGEEVFYRLKSGADFVLVHEAFLQRGPYCLEKIVKELDEVMLLKNFKSVEEIKYRGSLLEDIEQDYLKLIYDNKEGKDQ